MKFDFRTDPSASASGSRRFFWIVALGVWIAVALVTTVELHFRIASRVSQPSFLVIFLFQLVTWFVWVILAPLVWYLAKTFPLERDRWLRSLLIHGPACIATVVFYIFTASFLFAMTDGGPIVAAEFLETFVQFLVAQFSHQLLIYWGIVGFAHAQWFYTRLLARETKAVQLTSQLTQARLEALKTQVHPHFLFNTLHAIGVQVRKRKNEQAIDMLEKLGSLLRQTLNQGSQKIPLDEELDFINRYLAIESVRFQDRLTVTMEIDPDSRKIAVPNLILQPLVENAIRHGLSKKAGPGKLLIETQIQGDSLILRVVDDGKGLDPEQPAHPNEEGVGLSNTRSRIVELYGAKGRVDLSRDEGSRTTVATVVIPLLLKEEVGGEAD